MNYSRHLNQASRCCTAWSKMNSKHNNIPFIPFFLRNVSNDVPAYMVSHPRWQLSLTYLGCVPSIFVQLGILWLQITKSWTRRGNKCQWFSCSTSDSPESISWILSASHISWMLKQEQKEEEGNFLLKLIFISLLEIRLVVVQSIHLVCILWFWK